MANSTIQRANEILGVLVSDPELGPFADQSLPIPKVFRGTGKIKLVILGQDPTVKNEASRKRIKTVLNLDKNNSLRRYLVEVCTGLGLDLDENVYATNYFKNFFIKPPTQIDEIDVFTAFAPYWLPILKEEIAEFPEVPLITLGEPLLGAVVRLNASPKVRDYWGYNSGWKVGVTEPFSHLEQDMNVLKRMSFPFPHQPSIQKQFYRERIGWYIDFVKPYLS